MLRIRYIRLADIMPRLGADFLTFYRGASHGDLWFFKAKNPNQME